MKQSKLPPQNWHRPGFFGDKCGGEREIRWMLGKMSGSVAEHFEA